VPLFLAAPETAHPKFLAQLAAQSGAKLDLDKSAVIPKGGASGLFAIHEAIALVKSNAVPYAIAGGVDTFLDLRRLAFLDSEDRLTGASMDGFIPGEGAAFLLLGKSKSSLARITGVGLGSEKGHRYSKEPYRGDGLADAFRAAFASRPANAPKVHTVYAGFNGESMPAKEWGVAYLRNKDHFADPFAVEHPADVIGDAGAALGPIMVVLAALGIAGGHRSEACLVWSTSDREPRAAAIVERAEA
jgi:3-oxoacyl-[acyl-carrier-protein] synthase I